MADETHATKDTRRLASKIEDGGAILAGVAKRQAERDAHDRAAKAAYEARRRDHQPTKTEFEL